MSAMHTYEIEARTAVGTTAAKKQRAAGRARLHLAPNLKPTRPAGPSLPQRIGRAVVELADCWFAAEDGRSGRRRRRPHALPGEDAGAGGQDGPAGR